MGSIIEWSMAALFAVLSIILLSGRGAFLIAGYNTASKAERAMYDEKKLCRVMGSGMGAIAILMSIVASFGYDKSTWTIALMSVGIIVIVIVMLILCNTICKSKNPPKNYYLDEDDVPSKCNKKLGIGIIIFTLAILIASVSTLFTGDIKTTVNDTLINIAGSYWSDYEVSLDSIETVSIKTDIRLGKRTNGMGSFKLSEGSFKNDEFGSYTLYAYNKCQSYVILETSKGTVVINAETTEATQELYEDIVKAVKK